VIPLGVLAAAVLGCTEPSRNAAEAVETASGDATAKERLEVVARAFAADKPRNPSGAPH
jgi:hypothetical protein